MLSILKITYTWCLKSHFLDDEVGKENSDNLSRNNGIIINRKTSMNIEFFLTLQKLINEKLSGCKQGGVKLG